MQLGHAVVVDVLATAHGISEVHLPVVALVHVGQRRSQSTLGHHCVCLTQQRLAHQPYRHIGGSGLDGGAQAGTAGADDEDIVLDLLVSRGH